MASACLGQAHSEQAVAGQDLSVHILVRSWLPSATVRLAPQASEPGVGLSPFVHTHMRWCPLKPLNVYPQAQR